ncbi:MAG TPA: hypothetical protein VFQ65_15550, partial [Kofleriaceae bacterium]|nr:hypothetical protein [Kofleriaceae bacterium]
LAIALVLTASVASADPAAEKLFEDGRIALAANQLDAACDAFRRSEALEPRFGTLLNLGDCEERRKHVATAWEAFVEAKTLAEREPNSVRAYKEADRRATALAARLPYLLLAVARTDGLQVQRNGVAVPEAAWDHEVPVDPVAYDLTATAPHHETWTQHVTIVEGQHLRIEVPVLVETHEVAPLHDPVSSGTTAGSGAVAVSDGSLTRQAEPDGGRLEYHIGAGLLAGVSSEHDFIYGGRIIANVAPLGPGWVRVVPSLMYTSSTDAMDPYRTYKTYALGGTVEYAYAVNHQLLAAGGLGFGADLDNDSYGNSSTNEWGCLRLSPTYVFRRFEVGLHYQLVRTSDRFVSLFEAGLDFFVW